MAADYHAIVAALDATGDHLVMAHTPTTADQIVYHTDSVTGIERVFVNGAEVAAVPLPVLRADHFAQDDPPEGTPLQVNDDGRVWGLVAPSGVCHRGLPGCVTVESLEAGGPIDWQGGQTSSPLRLDDGTEIRTLPLTMRGGHPDTNMTAAEAKAHHDDTATVVADVIAWRSPAGVAVSGSLRSNLATDDLREMLGAAPSIEIWPTERGRVLLGIQLVPTPAWPVAACAGDVAILESGHIETDTGPGGLADQAMSPCGCDDEAQTLEQRVELLERFAVATLAAVPVYATLETVEAE